MTSPAGALFIAQLITLSIREAATILGFLCTLQTGKMDYVGYIAVVVILLNIITWPRALPK